MNIFFINDFTVYAQSPYDDSTMQLRRPIMEAAAALSGNQDQVIYRTPQPGVHGIAPDLPPRIDRTSKPSLTPPSTLLPTPSARSQPPTTNGSTNGTNGGTYGRSAHERLFSNGNGPKAPEYPTYEDEYSTRPNLMATPEKRSSAGNSLDRNPSAVNDKMSRTPSTSVMANGKTNGSSYDSVSSYDSCNNGMQSLRLGPNAPDDLKSVPSAK